MRSLFVAGTPSEEARSPGRRSNVENAPRRRSITGEPATPTSHIRSAIFRTPPSPPVTNQQRAHTPRKLGFALCCHSKSTGAPIANPLNNAQLGCSLYHAPKLHPGPSSVGVRTRTHRQTDTQMRVTTIHFASCTTHAKCNYILRQSYTTQNVLWSRASVCVSVCLSVCLCVCVSVRGRTPTLLHGPGCNLGWWYRLPPRCALLGGFTIGARVALLWQHNANHSYKLASIPRYDDTV